MSSFDLLAGPATVPLRGVLRMPGDKSVSHRALLLAALAQGTSLIKGLADGADVMRSKDAIAALGATVRQQADGALEVSGTAAGESMSRQLQRLDMGNSGSTTRLLTGMLAGINGVTVELYGDASLSARPMRRISEPLNSMGAAVSTSATGTLPLQIKGCALAGRELRLETASAQVAAALMLAAINASGKSSIHIPGVVRDHTERMLPLFACRMDVQQNKTGSSIYLEGPQLLQGTVIDVVSDISSAAFFIVAACLVPDSELRLQAVGTNPGRTMVLDILRRMGADIELENIGSSSGEPVADVLVRYAGRLVATDITPAEVSAAIDELPVLLLAAATATGKSSLRGAAELRLKESDRISAMASNLTALGIKVQESVDGMEIHGGTIGSATVDSFADHRIAMTMAVAALVSSGEVVVRGAESMAVSLPGFTELLRQAGVTGIAVRRHG